MKNKACKNWLEGWSEAIRKMDLRTYSPSPTFMAKHPHKKELIKIAEFLWFEELDAEWGDFKPKKITSFKRIPPNVRQKLLCDALTLWETYKKVDYILKNGIKCFQ
jgi:hypothetical protein